ncbi:hypothetical protein ACIBCA_05440 [Kitasatospora sp. NPDC051170]|uniref:hypothetical protein n=1 Tax=Kitasatospora sp. NPDC051170 TaxID=3364056 RepID=UPI0037B36EA3
MRARLTVVVPAVAAMCVIAVVVLYENSYFFAGMGDRAKVRFSAGQARERIDGVLGATMDGISPPLTYASGNYQVARDPDLYDGEHSVRSLLSAVVFGGTRISPAKLPQVMDQVARTWNGRGCHVTERHEPGNKTGFPVGLGCLDGDGMLLTLHADERLGTYLVWFVADLGDVRYRPGVPEPPLGLPATTYDADTHRSVTIAVNDPYWSV